MSTGSVIAGPATAPATFARDDVLGAGGRLTLSWSLKYHGKVHVLRQPDPDAAPGPDAAPARAVCGRRVPSGWAHEEVRIDGAPAAEAYSRITCVWCAVELLPLGAEASPEARYQAAVRALVEGARRGIGRRERRELTAEVDRAFLALRAAERDVVEEGRAEK